MGKGRTRVGYRGRGDVCGCVDVDLLLGGEIPTYVWHGMYGPALGVLLAGFCCCAARIKRLQGSLGPERICCAHAAA